MIFFFIKSEGESDLVVLQRQSKHTDGEMVTLTQMLDTIQGMSLLFMTGIVHNNWWVTMNIVLELCILLYSHFKLY